MSSILKALEKAEQSESARRSGGPSGLAKTRQRRPAWVLPVGVVGGAAVATLITFTAMGGFSRHHTSPDASVAVEQPAPAAVEQKVAVTPAPAPAAKAAPAPVAKAAAFTPAPKLTAGASLPASSAKPAVNAAAAKASKSAGNPPAKPVAAKAASEKTSSKSVDAKAAAKAKAKSAAAKAKVAKRESAKARLAKSKLAHSERHTRSPEVPVAPAAARSLPAPPAQVAAAKPAPAAAAVQPAHEKPSSIKVNGIAWQNSSESSAAIVNGRMVQHGAVVDGYKVEKIYEDKVRFSGKNGSFEVPLGGGD